MPMSFRCVIIVLTVGLAASATATAAAAQVQVVGGGLAGEARGDVVAYRGIPYAAPPVGAQRWAPPAPPDRWSGTRAATAFGARCMQFREDTTGALAPDTIGESEDCLFVNVYAPAHAARPLPVLVWIHGGGYVQGSGSARFYDGTALARQGIVVVTLNYRLGPLGFFAHPRLGGSANFGLLDQIAALQWVRSNIGAFGGDPGQVTVAGESAGGGSVLNLVTSPAANGLFARAIVESGGAGGGRTLAWANATGQRMGDCITHGAHDPLAALRAIPAAALRDSVRRCADAANYDPGPIIDGTVVLDTPLARFAAGKDHSVPMLIGTNSDEGSLLGRGNPWLDTLGRRLGDAEVERLDSLYAPASTLRMLHYVWGDLGFAVPARSIARARAADGRPTWVYAYTYLRERQRIRTIGAPHGSEIPMVFRLFEEPGFEAMFSPTDSAVEARVSAYWVSFIKTGDPGWPAYRRPGDAVMEFSDSARVVEQYRAAQLDEVERLKF
jgi:para-nitrobenzyl esterase